MSQLVKGVAAPHIGKQGKLLLNTNEKFPWVVVRWHGCGRHLLVHKSKIEIGEIR